MKADYARIDNRKPQVQSSILSHNLTHSYTYSSLLITTDFFASLQYYCKVHIIDGAQPQVE